MQKGELIAEDAIIQALIKENFKVSKKAGKYWIMIPELGIRVRLHITKHPIPGAIRWLFRVGGRIYESTTIPKNTQKPLEKILEDKIKDWAKNKHEKQNHNREIRDAKKFIQHYKTLESEIEEIKELYKQAALQKAIEWVEKEKTKLQNIINNTENNDRTNKEDSKIEMIEGVVAATDTEVRLQRPPDKTLYELWLEKKAKG